jgi:hypothetical protein
MMQSMRSSSNGFTGGVKRKASNPTDVQGGFTVMSSDAALPTGVTSSGINEARNNRGTNVRIPYARLVRRNSTSLHVLATFSTLSNAFRTDSSTF